MNQGFFPFRTDLTSFGRSSRSRRRRAPTYLRVHLTLDMFFRKPPIPDRKNPAQTTTREKGHSRMALSFRKGLGRKWLQTIWTAHTSKSLIHIHHTPRRQRHNIV